MYKPISVSPISAHLLREIELVYVNLCRTYISANSGAYTSYVAGAIANEATIDRHIRAFELYAPYIKPGMKILDWGCRYAPDSCMLRALYSELEIHGCDIEHADFSVFHDYARLSFTKLDHTYRLPYGDEEFDAVISSGVLEHVALESKSVEEIWRVLRDGGAFVITFLPNRFSITENLSRLLRRYGGHNRFYKLSDARGMFLRNGFLIEDCGFHQVFPTFAKGMSANIVLNGLANALSHLNRPLENVFPINRMSSNIYFVLRRASRM